MPPEFRKIYTYYNETIVYVFIGGYYMRKKDIIRQLKWDLALYNEMILDDEKFISENKEITQTFEKASFARKCISEYITRTLRQIGEDPT